MAGKNFLPLPLANLVWGLPKVGGARLYDGRKTENRIQFIDNHHYIPFYSLFQNYLWQTWGGLPKVKWGYFFRGLAYKYRMDRLIIADATEACVSFSKTT